MTQEAVQITTTPPLPGLQLVQAANKAFDTIATDFAGPADPAALASPYMTWADTGNGVLKRRNAAGTAWVVEGYLFTPAIYPKDLPGKNLLINSNFAINQDVVSGTVTLAAGTYGHDMWKAGASGCTYTFATVANVTTVTITAGSLLQVIEGTNLQSGPYTLSWAGTSQGRIDSGAYGPSPITGTAVGGTNQSVEFGIGTLSKVKYESGTVATPWCGYNGIYGGDSDAVLRYNEYSYDAGTLPGLTTNNGCEELVSFSTVIGTVGRSVRFKKKKYATPTVVVYSTSGGAMGYMYDSGGGVNRSVSYASIGQSGFYVFNAVVTTAPANHLFHWHAQARL